MAKSLPLPLPLPLPLRAAGNRVLAELPPKDRAAVLALCDESDLTTGVVIEEPGDEIAHVYFPLSGYISLVMPIDGAASLEVGLVGSEGMYGISLALGVDASPLHAVVQGDGRAWRMTAAAFRKVHAASRPLQRILNQHLYVRMCELAQSAACTRFHVLEARLARWLLMTHDRAHSNRFHLTHAFLAWMLGVRRTGVTQAANALQKRKLIQYSRGNISILDRNGLEAASCSCYHADRLLEEKYLYPK